jgi:hypothetical protein
MNNEQYPTQPPKFGGRRGIAHYSLLIIHYILGGMFDEDLYF